MNCARLDAVGTPHSAVLATLHGLCFGDDGGAIWNTRAAADLLAMPGAFAFVASRQEDPVGFALARLAADESEIIAIGVVAKARRTGIAGQLLDAVIDRAIGTGARRIFLEVAADNRAAMDLYRGRGFVICGQRPGYYRRPQGPVDAHVLALEIASEK